MKLYAEQILLSDGWHNDKTLTLTDDLITAIDDGLLEGAEQAAGPIIPGMVNCHSHAFQRAFAGFCELRGDSADSFWTWRKVMYDCLAVLNPEQLEVIASQLYIEMLKAGYTSVAEFHYLHHRPDGGRYDNPALMSESIFAAAQSSGIALTHLPVLYSYSGFGSQPPTDGQRRFIHDSDAFVSLLEHCRSLAAVSAEIRVGIAPHSLRAVAPEQLKAVTAQLHKIDETAPIHIHIAEQRKEVEDCLSSYGSRPVAWLLENLNLDERWCLIHATHVDQQERQALSESGAVAGICPTTEANLGDGIFPTHEYLSEAGAVAIGSDSHISVNPVEELRWLEYAQRLKLQQRTLLATTEHRSVGTHLWQQAARGGARAIGRRCGELAVGRKADLLVLDKDVLSLFCSQQERLLDSLIFASQSNAIRDVMVAGRWTVQAHRHPQQDSTAMRFRQVLKELF